jgi:hypothetical protein
MTKLLVQFLHLQIAVHHRFKNLLDSLVRHLAESLNEAFLFGSLQDLGAKVG